jgi:hypothetical protein
VGRDDDRMAGYRDAGGAGAFAAGTAPAIGGDQDRSFQSRLRRVFLLS